MGIDEILVLGNDDPIFGDSNLDNLGVPTPVLVGQAKSVDGIVSLT
jgi:hypothetical protein